MSTMASQAGAKRVSRDIQNLFSHAFSSDTTSVRVSELDEMDEYLSLHVPTKIQALFTVRIHICVHEGPYKGGHFVFYFVISKNYPFGGVEVWADLSRPIWHPNVELQSGRVLLPLTWSPVLTLTNLAMAIQMMLLEPSADNPLNLEACSFYNNDAAHFERCVQRTLNGGQMGSMQFVRMSRVVCECCGNNNGSGGGSSSSASRAQMCTNAQYSRPPPPPANVNIHAKRQAGGGGRRYESDGGNGSGSVTGKFTPTMSDSNWLPHNYTGEQHRSSSGGININSKSDDSFRGSRINPDASSEDAAVYQGYGQEQGQGIGLGKRQCLAIETEDMGNYCSESGSMETATSTSTSTRRRSHIRGGVDADSPLLHLSQTFGAVLKTPLAQQSRPDNRYHANFEQQQQQQPVKYIAGGSAHSQSQSEFGSGGFRKTSLDSTDNHKHKRDRAIMEQEQGQYHGQEQVSSVDSDSSAFSRFASYPRAEMQDISNRQGDWAFGFPKKWRTQTTQEKEKEKDQDQQMTVQNQLQHGHQQLHAPTAFATSAGASFPPPNQRKISPPPPAFQKWHAASGQTERSEGDF